MKQREFPEGVELRRYVPAIASGVRALRAQEERLASRFEPVGRELVGEDRAALEELYTLLDRMGASEDPEPETDD